MPWVLLRTYTLLFMICLLAELHFTAGNPQFYSSRKNSSYPEGHLTTPQLIVKYGYPAEKHQVVTPDGYILSLHRIPPKPRAGYKPVVLLQHGLLGSSADWVIAGPQKGLAYVLSDAGYDVWMGNARGNRYSRKHQWLTTRDKPFWNFGWHEMGVLDMPAVIDYILRVSRESSMYYVGHSMGCTMFYVMTSTFPEYNSKVRIMFSLAPGAFFSEASNRIFKMAEYSRVGAEANRLYNSDFLPNKVYVSSMFQKLCRDGLPTQVLCKLTIGLIGGPDSTQVNRTLLPLIYSHFPSGSSLKAWVHYGQLIRSGKFRQYDHGRELNLKYYGSPEPPDYNLAAITTPITVHAGRADTITTYKEIVHLYRSLPSAVGLFVVPLSTFSHFDFLWGIDAPRLVYDIILSLMLRY